MGTRTNQELIDFMTPENLAEVVNIETRVFDKMYKKRDAISAEELIKTVDRLIPNITFLSSDGLLCNTWGFPASFFTS